MADQTSGRMRIVSGSRPTGRLHLGHLRGALTNWLALQDRAECFFFVADWHALTTGYEDTSGIRSSTHDMVLDWLAVGLDPQRVVLFVQSAVKEHAELHLLLSMIVPTPWLLRNPTIKDQARELGLIHDESEMSQLNYGLLGYPVLQSADILLYRARGVPVGIDQVPHLELTREVARRFNRLYREVFPEPEALLTFIEHACRENVPFKATAGLHHALRGEYRLTYDEDSPKGTMFGFLNVFLTAAFVHAGMTDGAALALLLERDLKKILVSSNTIRWADRSITTDDIHATRDCVAVSFGSCSFLEPVNELRAAALLP